MFTSTQALSGGTLRGRFVRHTLASRQLGDVRGVTVRLPDNYNPEKKYPVVYLQDGQNMFDSRTGFMGQEWQVDETVDRLAGRIPDALYVAVDNGEGRRLEEYTHVRDADYGGGKGENYEQFFLKELVPAVEATYSTATERRFLVGSSLGGLVSLTMALNHPAAFAGVAALSPSVWWADGQLATQTLEGAVPAQRPKVWLDMGTEEGGSDAFGQRAISEKGRFSSRPQGANGVQDVRDRTREMGEALLQKGWSLDGDLRYHEPLGGTHTEGAWAARTGEVLSWILT